MNKVTLCENALDPSTWITHDAIADVCAFLTEHFIKFPDTAKIYLNQVSETNDVTPNDPASIERLKKLTGHFYVVVYPEGIETILIIVAIAVAAAAIGLSFLLRPHATTPNVPANQQAQSPNNQLADRQNTQRAGQRIPDIYGKVWSTPDLIQVPYRIFIAGQETEYSYMCIGRGSYTIYQIREDQTPVSQINGMSVEIYGPFTSPNSGSPVLRVGAAIGEPVRYVKASTSVNGQTLIAPNLAGAGFIGFFLVGDATTTDIWLNFTAESGSYSVNGTTGVQSAVSTNIEVGITPVDASGAPTGIEVFTTVTLTGSATLKSRVGATLKLHLANAGMVLVRAHRTSNTNIAASISVSDEVKWRDCYAISPISQSDFGNVTTVQTLTLPTPQALAIQVRKLNLLVTRNIPIGTLAGGVVTFAAPGPSRSAADVMCAIAQDQRIGNRTVAEIDFVGIYTAINAVIAYFGTTLCSEFCFTFDDAKVSFEESIADIAAACMCVAYRRGSLLTLFFEKKTNNSTLLFNHRNKVPKSETRTVTFGTPNDLDSIALTYIEPNDPFSPNQDIAKTLTFPVNRYHITALNGPNVIPYLLDLGVSIAGHNYNIQCNIKVTGLAPITVFDGFAHLVTINSGQSALVNFNFTGDGSTHILFQLGSANINDELNFDIWNLYIADLIDGLNKVPLNAFIGTGWVIVSGSTITVSPVDSPAINPKQITAVGIRNNVQAYILGSRLYNKLLNQNTVTQFQGTEEASVLVRYNRILVADNTRSDTQDGEVLDQNGLLLTLSQPVNFIGGRTYTIFLQHYDGTIESLGITAGPAADEVILAGAPSLPLVIDSAMWAKTTYMIVDNTPQRANAFLLTEKQPESGKIHSITAINYSDLYYQNDLDVFKGFITSNGPEGTGTPSIGAGGTYRPSTYNDLNPTSGDTGLATNAGTVSGFFTPATPPNNFPPFSDGTPADNEPGNVIWSGFAPVKINVPTTLHVVVSAATAHTGLVLNGTAVAVSGAGTYTVVIPANTYLSTIQVEATASPISGGSASISITDIFIS